VLKRGATPPPSSRMERIELDVNIEGDIENPYRYTFSLPSNDKGYWVVPKNYLEDLNPDVIPANLGENRIFTFATPGEYEPVTFVIYALKEMHNVTIKVDDLVCGNKKISKDNIEIRKVVRAPQKKMYWSFKDFKITSRYLFPFEPFDLKKGEFREIWLTIKVPEEAKPGIYKTKVSINPKNKPSSTINLFLEVFPFRLENPPKDFSMDYFLNPFTREKTLLELKDMKEHYVSEVHSHPFLAIRYDYPGAKLGYFLPKKIDYSKIRIDYSYLKKALSLLREAGFSGPVIIDDKLDELAGFFGYRIIRVKERDIPYADWAKKIVKEEEFKKIAKKAISGLKEIEKEYPEFEFWLVHMDEVFNAGRLPYYIALTKIAKQVPGFKFIQFFHTRNEEAEKMRKLIDPYVDIRCHHGYTFEWWLTRGHTFKEYKEELKKSGDIAWFYHNLRGVWVTPEWQRIINGLYMWINPFQCRLDACYENYSGSPFDGLTTPEFSSLIDTIEPVPTREWEAWREGVDDLRYIYTLEKLIEKYMIEDREDEVEEAIEYLEKLKRSLPAPQKLKPGRPGTPEEAPFINAIAQKFSAEDYQEIRYKIASFIKKLW